jgi:hypothetical protein
LPVTFLRHPSGAREMALEGPSRAIRVTVWIDVQHDLAPVGAFLIGIKQAKVGWLRVLRRMR